MISADYISANIFTVSGVDFTDEIHYGRKLIFDCGVDNERVITVSSSSWDGTVTSGVALAADSQDLTANLVSYRYGPGVDSTGSVGPRALNHDLLLNFDQDEHFTKASISGTDISLKVVGTPPCNNLQDWINDTQSAGVISGGNIIQHTDTVTAVTSGTAGNGEFKIGGDYTSIYADDLSISIVGSTGNDGQYTVSSGGSSHTGGTTTIPVDEAVSDATIDGVIHNGRCDVSEGCGIIKESESVIGETNFISWDTHSNLDLTTVTTNHIFVTNGDVPTTVSAVIDENDISHYTDIKLGVCYRSNGVVHPLTAGRYLPDFFGRAHRRAEALYGFKRTTGGNISEYGTRNIQSAAGTFYKGLNKVTTIAQTSTVDYFTSIYYDGSNWIWNQNQTQINNTQYNNQTTGALVTLDNNKYGVHWICIDYDSHIFSVFGEGSYTLTEAQQAHIPSSMPVVADEFGVVAAKIIIEKGASSFTEVISTYTTQFPSASPATHNDLAGIQGGAATDYYHLTSSNHTAATRDATNSQNGLMPTAKLDSWDDKYTQAEVDTISGSISTEINNAVHTRSHTMTSTSDHTSGNWKLFASNGAGEVTEIVHGTDNYVLTSNGATAAPTWQETTSTGIDDIVEDTTPQLGGDLDVNGKSINYGAIITVSGTYKGSYMTVIVDDSNSVFGTPLYCAADFHYERCCANSTTTMSCVGIALESSTGSKKMLLEGQACDTTWNWSAGNLYISTTSGTMTQTVVSGTGDQLQKIGFALSADTIYFRPDNTIVEIS